MCGGLQGHTQVVYLPGFMFRFAEIHWGAPNTAGPNTRQRVSRYQKSGAGTVAGGVCVRDDTAMHDRMLYNHACKDILHRWLAEGHRWFVFTSGRVIFLALAIMLCVFVGMPSLCRFLRVT